MVSITASVSPTSSPLVNTAVAKLHPLGQPLAEPVAARPACIVAMPERSSPQSGQHRETTKRCSEPRRATTDAIAVMSSHPTTSVHRAPNREISRELRAMRRRARRMLRQPRKESRSQLRRDSKSSREQAGITGGTARMVIRNAAAGEPEQAEHNPKRLTHAAPLSRSRASVILRGGLAASLALFPFTVDHLFRAHA